MDGLAPVEQLDARNDVRDDVGDEEPGMSVSLAAGLVESEAPNGSAMAAAR